MTGDQITDIYKAMDNRKQWGLLFSNFMAPLVPLTNSIRKETNVRSFFNYLDKDKKNFVTLKDLKILFNQNRLVNMDLKLGQQLLPDKESISYEDFKKLLIK